MNHRNRLIQLIHIAKRDLCLDDDTYRALLFANGEHSSCSKMNIKQLEMVLAVMEMQGFRRSKNPAGKEAKTPFKRRLSPKSGKAKHAQIDKIRAIWITMAQQGIVRDSSEAALDKYVSRMTGRAGQKGVEHVGWLDASQAYIILESLKNWHKRELADRMKAVGHCIPLNRNGTGLAGYQAVVDEYEVDR
ncbi:Mu gp16 gemA [Photobacterium aquae]|uniref:Mu gp16 gemA n=1 Tax=Photobacterium aquae TaxID=1195763 RepID=A0A0J1HD76_9GAMM|nr:regulatory protein GemA [Photobacterium aquae]KLV09590.1 Mu gp16 gemA [Photobacterium aquae]